MIGLGSKFHYETTPGSGMFVELEACITNINRGGATVSVVEDGCMRSPGGAIEKESGQVDYGQCTLDMNLDYDTYLILFGLVGPGNDRKFRIEFPEDDDGEILYETFDGFIQAFSLDIPWNEKITKSFTFEVSGEPELEVVQA